MSEALTETSCDDCVHCCAGKQGFRKMETRLLDLNKRCVQYSAGEVIVKQGSLLDLVYYLNEGLVKILIETDKQRKIILEIVSPQRYIGLNCINLPAESPVSFIALTDCHVCQIRKQHMMQIMQTNQKVNEKLMQCNGEELFICIKINNNLLPRFIL
jgi:CRP-like cAMP-binding protein